MRGTRHHLISVTLLLVFIASLHAEVAAHNDRARRYFTSDEALLETGRGPKVKPVQDSLAEVKIVSYNIRWRGGDELRKLIEFLRTDPEVGEAMILGLQEVDRNKKRSGKTNNAKLIADELGMHYAWAAPPTPKANQEEETGVAILSAFPLHDVRRIVLPHHGPGKRRRVALGATIQMAHTKIRFYSVHSETRIAVGKKLEQMQAVLADLATWPHDLPVVVLGDLNTWEPSAGKKTATLFRNAGFETPFDGQSTFCRRLLLFDLKLKLDWVWLRGFETIRFGIDREIGLSDHWPLWVVVTPVSPKPSVPAAAARRFTVDHDLSVGCHYVVPVCHAARVATV